MSKKDDSIIKHIEEENGDETYIIDSHGAAPKNAYKALEEQGLGTMGKIIEYLRKTSEFVFLVAEPPHEEKDEVAAIQMMKLPDKTDPHDNSIKIRLSQVIFSTLQAAGLSVEEIRDFFLKGAESCELLMKEKQVRKEFQENAEEEGEEVDKKSLNYAIAMNASMICAGQKQLKKIRDTWLDCPDHIMGILIPGAMEKGMNSFAQEYSSVAVKIANSKKSGTYDPVVDFMKDGGKLLQLLIKKHCVLSREGIETLLKQSERHFGVEDIEDGKE